MNKVTGKILLHETGVGIPNLVVTIYDVDSNTLPKDALQSKRTSLINFWEQLQGNRLGSILSVQDGTFVLEYEDKECKEERPDLLLFVTAPEGPGVEPCSPILYISSGIRQKAARIEQYLIHIPTASLVDAGVAIPLDPSVALLNNPVLQDSAAVINQLKQSETNKAQLSDGLRALHSQRLEKVRATTQIFRDTVQPQLLAALSSIPPGLTNTDAYVVGGRDVAEKTFKLIKKGIENVVNVSNDPKVRAPISGRIRLTQEQIAELQSRGYGTPSYGTPSGDLAFVPEDEIEHLLFDNTSLRRTNILRRENPFSRICRDKSNGEKCIDNEPHEHDDDDHGGDDDTPGPIILAPGPGIDVVTEKDVPRYIAKLLDRMTSPEESVSFGEVEPSKRADQTDVQRRIDALSFRRSPADVPAFYDFHSLQIAFESVWQEALDPIIFHLAAEAYKTIAELGGNPSTEPLGAPSGNARDLVMGLRLEAHEITQALSQDPSEHVAMTFDITREQWSVLNLELRQRLQQSAERLMIDFDATKETRALWREQGERLIRYADSLLAGDSSALNRLHKILQELEQRITAEPYGFTIYGANRQERSVNFGILITYRQKWDPVSYQAGELVKTITLAPKETRKFSKKTVIKRSRARKEAETNQSTRKEEFNKTSRAEAEIMRNAQAKTNFSLTTTGNVRASYGDIVGGEATHTMQFGGDASQTSNEVKKEFREAVFKASQEYRDERKLEVSTEESFEEEVVESGEIMNPNNELTATFLFYELQRRYKVAEHIHRILPVVLVAQEVPAPHEIDEEWLIAHDWILRRFLLDDSFLPALNYLCTRIVGDEVALKEMSKNVEQQRKLVAELKDEVMVYRRMSGQRYAALENEIKNSEKAARSEGLLEKGVEFFFSGEAIGTDPDAARIRERAAREAYEKAEQEERDFLARLNQEVTALNAITESYTKALSEHLNQKTQVARLRVHVKQNILYYMQAIWLMEPPDQRFFRLHDVKVPIFEKKAKSLYHIKAGTTFNRIINPNTFEPTQGVYDFTVQPQLDPEFETAPLVEVADLDKLLGFKGNYMIFPLKKSNPLTDFMIAPYVDQEWGLYDPDTVGNMTLDEFSDYVCCLKKKLSPEEFDAVKPELQELLKALLTTPLRDNEEIIVPTGSLFIEALVGVHTLVEDFQLMHRAIDVKKAQCETRSCELENIRMAARLLAGEHEDPQIERKIVIEGGTAQPVVPVDNE